MRTAIVLIDDHHHLRYANAAAHEILERGDALIERGGLLACRSSDDDAKLAMALRQLALAGNSYIGTNRGTDHAFLRIGRQLGKTVGLYLHAIRPKPLWGALVSNPSRWDSFTIPLPDRNWTPSWSPPVSTLRSQRLG
ncbi:MAG: hypothetical protein IPL11_09010 [Candidatus Accumulibacter sp.]|nr:hypothetical protein [Accumulibacter sp.]